MNEQKGYEIRTYKGSNDTDELRKTHVSFCGIPYRQAADPKKIILVPYIEWIEIIAEGKAYRDYLKPGDKPEASFQLMQKKFRPGNSAIFTAYGKAEADNLKLRNSNTVNPCGNVREMSLWSPFKVQQPCMGYGREYLMNFR